MAIPKGVRQGRVLTPTTITSRRETRRSAFNASTERPPVIIEWTSFLVRIGYAEQHKPQHILRWTNEINEIETAKTEKEWYHIIGPLLERIWKMLMTLPSTRRVVLLHPPYMERTWEAAMLKGLWNLSVPAVAFINSLVTVPIAMGWSRGMVIQVGMNETWCMAHVDGHALESTLQAVRCGYNQVVKEDGTVQTLWTSEMDTLWLDEHKPQSIIMAVVKCLTSSCMEVRRDVVSNLMFCGDAMVLVPDLARQVVQRLKSLFQQQAEPLVGPTCDLTIVPVSYTSLAPLASSIRAVSTAPHRADVVSWTGGSLWATISYRRDNEDTHTEWTFAPQVETTRM